MPRDASDVETFLFKMERTFDYDGEGTFLVSTGTDTPPVVVRVVEPVVVVRADFGSLPAEDAEKQNKLMRQMLEYNANDLIYAAYGLEDLKIVLSAGMELETLDYEELVGVMSDIELAFARHAKQLRELDMES